MNLRQSKSPRRRRTAMLAAIEPLEGRVHLSSSVLNYRNDNTSSGVNASESQLTPANVNATNFGKLFATTLDGQVYGQPLVDASVNITAGVNTTASVLGTYNVAYVVTENDSVYAIDASPTGGAILWQRSFLATTNTGGDLNNPMGATKISTVTISDVGVGDIAPTVGITGTPVIDVANNAIYCLTKTKEVIGGVTTFVQRIHALSLSNGADLCTPYQVGATSFSNSVYTNNTPIYVYGVGAGSAPDTYQNTAQSVVPFNALREANRVPLSLVNGRLYAAWASHGDNGPYHGWVVTWDVSNLATNGLVLNGVLNTSPNNGEAGIWQGGGQIVFDPDEANTFYFATGNGAGGAPTLGPDGLPTNANYNEAIVKAIVDPTSTPTSMNPNGWGLKITSFFIPYNVAAMDSADSDFGSGAPLILPDSAGVAGHPHLLVAGGKDGRIFLLDRDALGGYNPVNDQALNSILNKSGNLTAPYLIGGQLSTASYFNGKLYVVGGYNSAAQSFSITSAGQITPSSQTAVANFGFAPGSPSVSAYGNSNGIVWITDRNTNELHAYASSSLSTELWNSAQAAGGADNPGGLVKFASPTVVNGEVYVGTTSGLVVYGLKQPPTAVPIAPVLSAQALSGASINLTWTDATTNPNTATQYLLEESTDDISFTQVGIAQAGATSTAVGNLSPNTKYYFYIEGVNPAGNSQPSNVASAMTTNEAGYINFGSGFSGVGDLLQLNGSAAINGAALQLTTQKANEAASAFYEVPIDDTGFSTQFTFQSNKAGSTASGFTFTLQNAGITALGASGSGLGYATIGNSVAVKFDLANDAGEGADSTGLYINGATPTKTGSIDLTHTPINLHNGDLFLASLTYDGSTLTETLTDTVTQRSVTENYAVNIPATIGSSDVYAGFTASTGGLSASQQILSWSFTSTSTTSPNAPTGLGATAASASSVMLNWTPNATNQMGYHLDRATDPNFTQNVVTQTLSSVGASYVDTAPGIAPGNTYYYRLRAYDLAGDSSNSNTASAAIPVAPPTPTGQSITSVSATEIDITWQDNAGHAAQNYQIFRAMNYGAFSVVATLPPTSRPAPSAYSWSDTGLTPGAHYEYHIEAVNVAGHNDFAGVNANTLTAAPSSLVATPANGTVTLAWSPVSGAVTYNVYRGLSSGGEGTTPLASGLTTAGYVDSAVTNGVTYYYTVTAVNPNTPPLPAESAMSIETSATPLAVSASLFTTAADIGSPALAGSSSFSNGVYTINGSGSDIYGSSDQFQYDYATLSGDHSLSAQVTSVQSTHSWAKAAVMFRDGTAANAAFADVVVTPSGKLSFQWRTSAGAAAHSVILTNLPAPRFVKLTRIGNSFTANYSADGVTWTAIGKSVTIAMSSTYTAGLGVCSLNPRKICQATFANVALT